MLTTTALVHECFERMRQSGCDVHERGRFLAYAARAMRSVLVDDARRRQSQRRGEGSWHFSFDEQLDAQRQDIHLLQVHEALQALEAHDLRLRQVVEMRYFVGLTEEETSEALSVSLRTVQREWEKARRVLHALMSEV